MPVDCIVGYNQSSVRPTTIQQ